MAFKRLKLIFQASTLIGSRSACKRFRDLIPGVFKTRKLYKLIDITISLGFSVQPKFELFEFLVDFFAIFSMVYAIFLIVFLIIGICFIFFCKSTKKYKNNKPRMSSLT